MNAMHKLLVCLLLGMLHMTSHSSEVGIIERERKQGMWSDARSENIVLGARMRHVVTTYFNTISGFTAVLITLVMEYAQGEKPECPCYLSSSYPLVYSGGSDLTSALTKIFFDRSIDNRLQKSRHFIWGVEENGLPLVREGKFIMLPSDRRKSSELFEKWDSAEIGKVICESYGGNEALYNNYYFIDSTQGRRAEVTLNTLTPLTLQMIEAVLRGFKVGVYNGQQRDRTYSALCGIPGLGPREFAQSLKNAYLWLVKNKKRKEKYQDIVAAYTASVQEMIQKVIDDGTASSRLVFVKE
jgi:hypothetical protein